MTDTRLTAITGGIGAGKSVVARILTAMGYDVYDSDSRAKKLMDDSAEIKRQLIENFGSDVIDSNNNIDRKRLASIVFADNDELGKLNSIVHGAVLRDIERWRLSTERSRVFVETAILYQSGMDKMVDDVWEVVADEAVRVKRVMARNGVTAEEAMKRIEAQRITVEIPHPEVHQIDNSGKEAILPQIHKLL